MRLDRMLQMVETEEVQERRGFNKEIWELQREKSEESAVSWMSVEKNVSFKGLISGISVLGRAWKRTETVPLF